MSTEPTESRAIPLLGDISLAYGQVIEHALDAGFVAMPVAGLEGSYMQRLRRGSHQIRLVGVLFGPEAKDQLKTLQEAASTGEALTFAADISEALELQQVVITRFNAREEAGSPNRFMYELFITESPPLPEPAQVGAFGGLDDFGVGDLGFDTDILGDLEDLAGDIAGAVDDALDVIDQLGALANLDGLSVDGILEPLDEPLGGLAEAGEVLGSATDDLLNAFS